MSTDTPARAPRQRAAALTQPSGHLGARCVRPWREARLRVGPWRRVWYGASHELACCSPRGRSCVWPLTPVRPLPPQKRKSKKQLRQLEELFFGSSREFDPDVRVTSDLIGEAMERTGLEEKQIRQWFQYKRNKARVVTTSHDPLLVAYNVSGRGVSRSTRWARCCNTAWLCLTWCVVPCVALPARYRAAGAAVALQRAQEADGASRRAIHTRHAGVRVQGSENRRR